MFLAVILAGVIILLLIISFVYKKLSHRDWLQTDDGILQAALDKLIRNPKDTESLRTAAQLFYKKKQYDKAFEHFSKLLFHCDAPTLETIPKKDRFQIFLEFGLSAYKLKKYEDTVTNLQKARRIMPESSNERLSSILGRLLYKKNNLSEAANELERAYQSTKNAGSSASNANNMFYLGMCYFKLGKFIEALPLLHPLESHYHDDPQFMLALASCYDKIRNKDAAIKSYLKIAKDPIVGAAASSALAHIFIRNHDTSEALRYLKHVPELENPRGELTQRALYDSAKIYGKLGELQEACVPLQQLYELNPDYRDTRSLLRNYQDMARNYNLYLLYYGDKVKRKDLVHKLLTNLLSGIRSYEIASYSLNTIELTVNTLQRQAERNYYVWVNLADELIQLEHIREAISRGKQHNCNRYMVISPYTFDTKAVAFSEARPIELIEGKELREQLLKIP